MWRELPAPASRTEAGGRPPDSRGATEINTLSADTINFTAPFLPPPLPGLDPGFPIFGGKTSLASSTLAFASSDDFKDILNAPAGDLATSFAPLIGRTIGTDWRVGLIGANNVLLGLQELEVQFKITAGATPDNPPSAVPEPSTPALVALGLLLAAGLRRRSRAA